VRVINRYRGEVDVGVAVSLRRVADELEAHTDGYAAHLNLEAGEHHTLRKEKAALVAVAWLDWHGIPYTRDEGAVRAG
jgi:hypothetical protein